VGDGGEEGVRKEEEMKGGRFRELFFAKLSRELKSITYQSKNPSRI
jgi:hypothetical protein